MCYIKLIISSKLRVISTIKLITTNTLASGILICSTVNSRGRGCVMTHVMQLKGAQLGWLRINQFSYLQLHSVKLDRPFVTGKATYTCRCDGHPSLGINHASICSRQVNNASQLLLI